MGKNKLIRFDWAMKTIQRYKDIIQRKIDEWIYIFKNNEVAEGSSSKNIDKAEQKLAELNMGEQERKVYDKYLINTARDRDAINTAKEEGHETGKSEGRAEGKAEGRTEGKIEGIELMIVNGYKAGGTIEFLSVMAQISEDEVKEILKKHTLHF